LRGLKASSTAHDGAEVQTAIDVYTEAIRIDPNYALAFAARSIALSTYGAYFAELSETRMVFDRAHSDAQKAIALAPELADGHLARANATEFGSLDFERAAEEYQRAMSLAPGNAAVVQAYGQFAVLIGRTDTGIAAARHAVLLDPLNPTSHRLLTNLLYIGRRFNEAIESSQVTLTLDPENTWVRGIRGTAYYARGDYQNALASCEKQPDKANYHIKVCLAVSYHKLSKQANAETILAALKAEGGDSMAYQYTEIYAQWGDTAKALTWLETAMRLRDPGLSGLKTDPLLDPLRKEPRFQAIERELKFPS
jgi:serine/threonine-protein kinase